MANSKRILLSFIVVTHNHENCISRCLDSIISQDISIPYEIIVGDDNSQDNTWAIIASYKDSYPNLFTIYQVNSDDCRPLTLSDRASYNRGHAYGMICGKYYAEVDGDDYLLPGNTYQKQVELLEGHPECWLCMHNMSILKDGEPQTSAQIRFSSNQLDNFQIISADYYILHPELFSQHQSFVFRRNVHESPIDKLGLDYEDTTVTLFHLQYGNIIYLNQMGYQYIIYPSGINMLLRDDDRLVELSLLELKHILLFPKFSDLILKASLPKLIHLLKVNDERRLVLSSDIRKSFSKYNGFMFRYFEKEEHSLMETCRIRLIRGLLLLMKRYALISRPWLSLAFGIMY